MPVSELRRDARTLWTSVRSSGRDGFALLALTAVEVATLLAVPGALAAAVDAISGGGSSGNAIALVCVVLVLGSAAGAGTVVLEKRAQVSGTLLLRRRLVRHLLRLDLGTFRRYGTGDLLGRISQSAVMTASAVTALAGLLVSAVTSIAGLVLLVLLDVRLGLIVLAAAPLIWWQAGLLLRRMSANTTEYQTRQGELTGHFTEAIRGARTIRASGTAAREVDRVVAGLPALTAAGHEFWRVLRTAAFRVNLVMPLLQVAVLAVAGHSVLHGRMTAGELLAAQGYFGYAVGMFQQTMVLGRVARALGSATMVAEVLAEPARRTGTRTLPPGPGALSLRGVRVSPVFDSLDADFPPGVAIAIVGRSGAGKSTLTEVAGGLLVPEAGEIRLDGVPLTELRPGELSRAVTYAFEKPVLHGETVADAIGHADRPATGEQVERALRVSAAADFVHRLPDGTGTRRSRLALSGGELQRLGLARAAWRDARVVVLDDATSSLDTATEAEVTAALDRALRGRTRLIVAHRAATAAAADLVAWLDGGRIRALAPHRELLRDPDYRALFGLRQPAVAVADVS
ncbi:ABC transporter ATP-binding protein [Amycolatopsis magusensis]|uniref:ABC transporter ATP-binding protein n=1 Tax=Amycolatopsis magusensis TaxID=882444 RepID=UPI0024A7A577|nr:ABC transporter ATP-binding protein [Amycolatopsis magusensis]MDI5980187.1 ABC transporter ATP-binding protein [Amycolatopsis magusensis]